MPVGDTIIGDDSLVGELKAGNSLLTGWMTRHVSGGGKALVLPSIAMRGDLPGQFRLLRTDGTPPAGFYSISDDLAHSLHFKNTPARKVGQSHQL